MLISTHNHHKNPTVSVDGKIDKGGATEKCLWGTTAKKYVAIKKGAVKPLAPSIETKKNDAINGTDAYLKESWTKIMDAWNKVSPYLPETTRMESGLRTKAEQRSQLYEKYGGFSKNIGDMFGISEFASNRKKSRDTTINDSERNTLDKTMHSQICAAVSSREVALPGTSKHESGKAIDTQISSAEDRVRALLWYSVEFPSEILVHNITKESNSCVHFEFK